MAVNRAPLGTPTIKYRGIFDVDGLFAKTYDWMVHDRFEVYESKYKHKIPDPRGIEDEITLRGWRRVNDYVMFNIEADFHIWEMKYVEVVKDGVKKTMAQARIKIQLSGNVEFDYANRFGGSKFLLALHDFYQKFIVLQEIEGYWWDQHYYRMYKLHQIMKEHLDMETKTFASAGRW